MRALRTHAQAPRWLWVVAGAVGVAALAVLGVGSVHAVWNEATENTTNAFEADSWQISATANFTCRSTSLFEGWCWGENKNGQLGDGSDDDRGRPTAAAGLLTTAAGPVIGADKHSCVVATDTRLLCWGRNDTGQLGDGTTDGRTIPGGVTSPFDDGDFTDVASLAPGATAGHSCAVTTGGEIRCWGMNGSGQVGDTTTTDRTTPTGVAPRFTHAAASPVGTATSSCVLQTDATVACWGANDSGQLGDGTTTERLRPVEVVGTTGSGTLDDVIGLDGSTGGQFVCAVDGAGDVYCWGQNKWGQVGDGTTTDPRPTPQQVVDVVGGEATLSGATDVATGAEHACASTSDGVFCWGLNRDDQLGDDSGKDSPSPVQVVGVGGGMLSSADQVVAGASHSCALVAGEVFCWGGNKKGQLGHGKKSGSPSPVQVAAVGGEGTLTGVTSLAAGTNFVCAVRSGGSVVCWGENGNGQLGDGSKDEPGTPVEVAGVGVENSETLSGVVQVAAGEAHACAVKSDGTAVCWGRNDQGQLGDGTPADSERPVDVVGGEGLEEIGVGAKHGCATTTDNELLCWGQNAGGQLGDGTTTRRNTPTAVVAPAGTTWTGVAGAAVGTAHSCLVETEGGVFCWGANAEGQLGDGSQGDERTSPVRVAGVEGGTLPAADQVVAGASHSCALASGEVFCWGSNEQSQLGHGKPGDAGSTSPVQVVGVGGEGTLTGVTSLAAGANFVCAVRSDSSVVCWGANGEGQLGHGEPEEGEPEVGESAEPLVVVEVGGGGTLSGVVEVAAGGAHACAARSDGTAACWGLNDAGQLGDGTASDSDSPVEVTGVSGLEEIGAGAKHTCATTTENELYCWGENTDGKLGDGTTDDRSTPTAARGGEGDPVAPVLTATAGGAHSCMSLMDLTVLCWGENGWGQLGTGDTADRSFPVPTVDTFDPGHLGGVHQVAAGDEHTCALLEDTTVVCWGRDDKGQLGNASTTGDPSRPHQVVGADGLGTLLSEVTWLAAGAKHTCAVDSSNEVHCWGLNDSGQLGNGTTTGSDIPVPVVGVSDTDPLPPIRQVNAGANHTCAVSTSDEAYCWGANDSGQVGDNSTTNPRTRPRQVVGPDSDTLADVRWVDGGTAHTCATTLEDQVFCWGSDAKGQLGDGPSEDGSDGNMSMRPVQVVPPEDEGSLSPVSSVAAGSEHSCAFRRDDSTAYCWGANDKGQLGNPGVTERTSSLPVVTDGP